MPINTSPKYMEVDKVLSRAYFWKALSRNMQWPWSETHFIRCKTCMFCHAEADQSPEHLVIKMVYSKMVSLLQDDKFWCKACNYCLYDHYTLNDCDFCWIQQMHWTIDRCSFNCLPNGH